MSRPCSNPGRLVVALLPLVVPFAFSGVADAQASPRAQPAAPLARIDDPLLAPPEPARHQLADWNEALDLIHLWSTDLDIAVQGVERARGSSRQALALALPTLGASGSVSEQLLTGTSVPGTASNANPSLQAQFVLSQPILAPRAWYGVKTADMGVTSARLSDGSVPT